MMNGYNFTESVRHVLAIAREEAVGLHHEYVGTEHILLGLGTEGEGVGVHVLQSLGVSTYDIRQTIIEILKPGRSEKVIGPDLPYTSRAKRVLELALKEARDLNHSYVGTEHLLLGLLAEEKGIAAQVLNHHGATLDAVRAEVVRVLGSEPTLTSRLTAMPLPPEQEEQGSPRPVSYSVEIEYEGGTAVRHRFPSRKEALHFLLHPRNA